MADPKNEYHPDWVTSPGDVLLEMLDERGMTVAQLAKRIGQRAQAVQALLEGVLPLSPEIAHQLELALGAPAAFWHNLERSFRQSASLKRPRDARVRSSSECLPARSRVPRAVH